MPRPVKSQWDFGDLFHQEPVRQVVSVSELTLQIKRLLEGQMGRVWVTGEITNLRAQSSGHIYFTLKDAAAQLNCVLFRGEPNVDRALLRDGCKVVLGGDLTVYEPRGQYQLRVTAAEPQGIGALQAAFERLKQKLQAQGWFAPERKRPLPRYPQRLGLVTSPTGAAIQDVLHVVGRRNPGLEFILAPCRVQGEGAAAEIASALGLLNEFHRRQSARAAGGEPAWPLDLILVTRGGGSLEDLWAFNEESVARAIFESALPVVSAVGHEIDFTISDFVADLRAATPSAAAEILTEGVFQGAQFVMQADGRLRQLALRRLAEKHSALDQAGQRLARMRPRRRLEDWLQRLDEAEAALARAAQQGVRRQHVAFDNLAARFARVRPSLVVRQRRESLEQAAQRFREQARHRLRAVRDKIDSLTARLRLLGPEQVLARGYSITLDAETGAVVRAASALRVGQRLRTRLGSGEATSVVEK